MGSAHLEHHDLDAGCYLMRTVRWSMRPVAQSLEASVFVARQPAVHRPP